MRLLRPAFLALVALAVVACGLVIRNSGQLDVPPRRADGIRIATHNVHFIRVRREEGPWSMADWMARRDALDAAFKAVDADIMSFQEMESFAGGNDDAVNHARAWLLDNNPDYGAAAIGDWRSFPSTQPIFYRKERLRVSDQGWFFFSDTPDAIYSHTFNGSYPAFASWVRFHDTRSGHDLRVVNVHFEYRSRSNRLKSAELVRARITPWITEGETVVLAGDINAMHGTRTMRILEESGLRFTPVSGATYHFNRGINLFGPIDHIAVTPGLVPAGEPVVLRRPFGAVWPSDHYPVLADFTFAP